MKNPRVVAERGVYSPERSSNVHEDRRKTNDATNVAKCNVSITIDKKKKIMDKVRFAKEEQAFRLVESRDPTLGRNCVKVAVFFFFYFSTYLQIREINKNPRHFVLSHSIEIKPFEDS